MKPPSRAGGGAKGLARRLVALPSAESPTSLERAAAAQVGKAEPGLVVRATVALAKASGIPARLEIDEPGVGRAVASGPGPADAPTLGELLDAAAGLARLPILVEALEVEEGEAYRVTWPPRPPASSWLAPFARLRRAFRKDAALRLELDVGQAERGELEALVTRLQELVEQRDRSLAQAEARYRALAEDLSIAVFAVDGGGRITFASSRAEKLLGLAPGAAGLAIEDVLETEAGAPAVAEHLGLVASGESEEESFEASPARDGGTRLLVTLAPMRDQDRLVGTVQLLRDRGIEGRLVQAQRLEAIGRMASALAHQVNNPAAAVRLSLESIKRRAAELRLEGRLEGSHAGAELRESVDDALEGMGRIMTVLADLLAFADEHEARLTRCDVDLTIAGAVRLLENRIRHVARLELDFGARCDVLADQTRFSQVIVNILSNAVTAVEEAGRGPGSIWIRSRRVSDHVTIEIADNGVGLPPEELDRLRRPLVSGWRSHTTTGLGLATSDRVLAQMGGRIEVTARPGGGTVMLVVVPVAAPRTSVPPMPGGADEPLEEEEPDRPRILIVDDERPLLRAFERLLRRRVDVVTSDSIARLEALLDAGERFDLVVCDLIMPDRSIIDAYDGLRERHPWLENRFVLCTGGGFTDEATRFVADRGLRMLPKPFTPEAFDRVLAEVTGKSPFEDPT